MAYKNILRNLLARSRAGKNGEKEAGEAHILHLSAPLLAGLGLVLVCAVGWAFFMGFMVGRGQSPHEELQAMTGGIIEPPAIQKPMPNPDIMPEEREFFPDERATAAPGLQPAIAPAQPMPAKQAARPQPKKEDRPKPPIKKAADDKFVYKFQLAAFKTKAEADNLRKKLSAKGVNASVVKSGSAYLLTAGLRGSSKDVEKLLATLKTFKLGKPLQLSKKPVDAPKKAKKQ